ncbi:hypothetical protein [Pseudomonas hunanensis]|uniref:hypothetical protein n=1 Tax=Pseudomonas hunanensis TaxID=1247546 RepID=UPI00240657C6|nr:hypothetical protein [Pseudomonas hunanensis]MDF9756055.1 hypothetical protein [Pseudomonas hunanensis]
MAQIDLDKVGAALAFLQSDPAGASALKQLRGALDTFAGGLPQNLEHPEQVFLLRTLMADLSIDHPAGIPNVGAVMGAGAGVQALGTPTVKSVHGFSVMNNK